MTLYLCFQEKVAQTSCMSACKHISQHILELLTAEEVKSLSLAVVQQFNLDLKQCEGNWSTVQPVLTGNGRFTCCVHSLRNPTSPNPSYQRLTRVRAPEENTACGCVNDSRIIVINVSD